jgi:hypothetical protein
MSHSVAAPKRNWPWVVAVLAVVVAIVVGASIVSSLMAGPTPQAADTPTATAPVETPSPAAPAEPSTTPSSSPTALSVDDVAQIQAAIEANRPIDLYDYLDDPVHITFAASDFDSDRSPDLAITDLDYVRNSTGWNWNLDDATLASFRAGTYANYFPDDAIIGQSAETYVIAFTITDDRISRIFVSKSAAIVTEPLSATPTPAP